MGGQSGIELDFEEDNNSCDSALGYKFGSLHYLEKGKRKEGELILQLNAGVKLLMWYMKGGGE